MNATAGQVDALDAAPKRSRLRAFDALGLVLTLSTLALAALWAFPLYWGLVTTFNRKTRWCNPVCGCGRSTSRSRTTPMR